MRSRKYKLLMIFIFRLHGYLRAQNRLKVFCRVLKFNLSLMIKLKKSPRLPNLPYNYRKLKINKKNNQLSLLSLINNFKFILIYSRGNKLKVSNSQRQSSVHEQGKVASNMNYLKHYITDTEKYPLEQQLKQFLNKIEVNDKNIYWGDDGTAQDRDNRINKFYHTMSNYAKFQYFKNKNLQESKSQKAKQLDEEYQLLVYGVKFFGQP